MSALSRFMAYLDASPSPFHAVAAAAERLAALGFVPFDEAGPPSPLAPGDRRMVLRGGSLLAFRVGSSPAAEAGFRIIAAHTDSPNLRIKPNPYLRSHGCTRLAVEVYGGTLDATWADRDLGLAGRVVVRDGGGQRSALVDLRTPLCRIPNLAIHLNREVNDKGLVLNRQTQLPAVFAIGASEADPLRELLGGAVGVAASDVLTWDLMLVDTLGAARVGWKGEMVASGRLDNLASCANAIEAMELACAGPLAAHTSGIALFDHEEVGSTTSRGADGRMIERALSMIVRDGPSAPGGLERALANSVLVSADMAHGVHPGFADKHDGEHMPRLNGGPVIKQNSSQRYATEGETSALFVRLCEDAGVPVQWFVNRSDLACGSTVGPMLAARLGVPTVDVGCAMWSMHSAREACGADDVAMMGAVMGRFLG